MIFTKIFRSICLATSLLLITIESCFSRNLTRCASFVSPSELFFVFCFVFAFYTFYFLCHFPSSSLLCGCQCNQLFHSFRAVFPLLLRFRPSFLAFFITRNVAEKKRLNSHASWALLAWKICLAFARPFSILHR